MEELQQIHKKTYDHLVTSWHKYEVAADKKRRHVEFEVGDLVWAFWPKSVLKLMSTFLAAPKIGPLEILEKINPSLYCLQLLANLRMSDLFNVKHLVPYVGENYEDWTSLTIRGWIFFTQEEMMRFKS